MNLITDEIKKLTHFDFGKFRWTEAVAGPDGKSSAGKMIAFWYGIALIIIALMTVIAGVLKWIAGDQVNSNLLFVGVQMPIVLGYLLGNKAQEIKKSAQDQPGNGQ